MSGAIFISDDLVLIVTDFFSEKILNFPNKFEIALGEEASLEKLKRQINKMLKNCKTVNRTASLREVLLRKKDAFIQALPK